MQSPDMLTEPQICDLARSRGKVLIPAMIASVVGGFAYLMVIGSSRESAVAFIVRYVGREIAECVLILPAFAVVLTPVAIAGKFSKRFATICPLCSANIDRSTARVLATRCCSACGGRIVAGGRERRVEVYKRYRKVVSLRFLRYWLWAWPMLGAVAQTWYVFDPMSLERCVHFLFLPGLIGASAGGWASLRMRNCRYLPQSIVSAISFATGAVLYWQGV